MRIFFDTLDVVNQVKFDQILILNILLDLEQTLNLKIKNSNEKEVKDLSINRTS